MLKPRIQIALAVVVMATFIPLTAHPQTSESAIEVTTSVAEKSVGNTHQPSGENNTNTGFSKNSEFQVIPNVATNIETGVQTRFNEIRRELLDERALFIDRWLAVIAIVLTFFGVIVAIAGFVGFRKFREIEKEAKASAKIIADAAEAAERDSRTIRKKSDEVTARVEELDATSAGTNAGEVTQTVANVRDNPDASLVDRAIADAVSLQQQGKQENAIEKWRAIAQISEESNNELAARAWFSIGILSSDENITKKISSYDRAIQLNSNFYGAYVNRAIAKAELGRHGDAFDDLDIAVQLKPDKAEIYLNRGIVKKRLGRYADAIVDYNKAIELNPDMAEAYANRGIAKSELERYADAIADFDKAIQLNPNKAKAYLDRGILNTRLERFADAIADFDKMIQLNPDMAEAYRNRGIVKRRLGRHKDAIADYDKAIELKPDLAKAYVNRGIAKFELGFKVEGKSDFETAIELARNSNNVELIEQLEQNLHNLSATNGN